MAGRIRSIKPEILEDEKAAALSDTAWRLWVSSWVLADDHGRFRASAGYLMGQVFWARGRSQTDIESALGELGSPSSRLITLYVVNGQRYAFITNWQKHQRVDNAGKARCPGPDEGELLRESPRVSANGGGLPPDLRSPTSDLDPENDQGTCGSAANASAGPVKAKRPQASEPAESEWPAVKRILGKLSEAAGVNYASHRAGKPTSSVKFILRRLREGCSEDELRMVIRHRFLEWGHKPEMREHLTAETIFGREKFDTYLAKAKAALIGNEPRAGPASNEPPSPVVMAILRGGGTDERRG